MTEKCYDEGIIQAFLDGELAAETVENISRHVAVCDDCALLLAVSEEESALAYTALEQEFNTLVPTQRLWTKINDSIEREKKSFWKPIFALLLRPSTAAFASLLFVAVVSITLFTVKQDLPVQNAALTNVKESIIVSPQIKSVSAPINQSLPVTSKIRNVPNASDKSLRNEARAIKAAYVSQENVRTPYVKPIIENDTVVAAPPETLSGEASYLKTIATLTQTVNNRKDEVLDSSSRFAFERDLAVTDDAIKQMRQQVEKNPRDEAAKQILRSSYQNKIDLLNSVADKTELMASLR